MENRLVIDSHSENSVSLIQNRLIEEIIPALSLGKVIVILCIGTDRSTGDSLGPIVGDYLVSFSGEGIYIYGSLEYPVHAKNLNIILNEIHINFPSPYIIAVDASLGSSPNIGKIIIENKPLNPGSALKRDLPAVGDISITGIVNVSSSLDFLTLQSTRLFTVMHMARVISRGIFNALTFTQNNHALDI